MLSLLEVLLKNQCVADTQKLVVDRLNPHQALIFTSEGVKIVSDDCFAPSSNILGTREIAPTDGLHEPKSRECFNSTCDNFNFGDCIALNTDSCRKSLK